jgi:hypothetical protein
MALAASSLLLSLHVVLGGLQQQQHLKLVTFDAGYNIHEYPSPDSGQPLKVGFQINLRNVLEVNEVSQLCSLETTIRFE